MSLFTHCLLPSSQQSRDRAPGASIRDGALDRGPQVRRAQPSSPWGRPGGACGAGGAEGSSPPGAQGRRGTLRAGSSGAGQSSSPPALPLPSRQHLGRAGGGAAALRWQKRVETWRQVTERGARWGLGNQPRVAGDPRPLAVSLAPPAEPPVSGGIHPVTGSGTWPR